MNVLKQQVVKLLFGLPNQLGMLVTFWNAPPISHSNDTSEISRGEMVARESSEIDVFFMHDAHCKT